ncbi:uncharacterized protein G2W53_001117 [Senna tora]|uniref:Uncharacterized protein n=1 Tax=Senna tora TaxID=362788 RepID=A0A834XFL0_9FABA|nr:uncharacterized protein G2W53_001117 [Senna tora]
MIASQESLGSTSRLCCCTSESKRSIRVVFGSPTEFNARVGLVIAWKVCKVKSNHILNRKSRLNLKRIEEELAKRDVAYVSQTNRFSLYLGTLLDLIRKWDSRSHGSTRDHMKGVSGHGETYFELKRAFESQKNSRSTSQTRCCPSESIGPLRVVFGNLIGFNARIGQVIA